MDPDSQTDKPPQGNFQSFTNFLGAIIALLTLVTPIASIAIFSSPPSGYDPLLSSQELNRPFTFKLVATLRTSNLSR